MESESLCSHSIFGIKVWLRTVTILMDAIHFLIQLSKFDLYCNHFLILNFRKKKTWNPKIEWTLQLSSSKIGWNLGVCVLTVFLGSSCDWRRWRFWWMRYICEFQHHRISIWPKICNCPCPAEYSGSIGHTALWEENTLSTLFKNNS